MIPTLRAVRNLDHDQHHAKDHLEHQSTTSSLLRIARSPPSLRRVLDVTFYHAYTIWLFTFSDLKTIIVPTSLFGIVGALSGAPLLSGSIATSSLLSRIPHVFFWTWSTLLPFAINNQCQDHSIAEDSLNKPWRPLPSKRISQAAATQIMLCLYVANLIISCQMGSLPQALSMLVLGIWYNRLGGADRSCVEKNLINALGYLSFISGALIVVADSKRSTVSYGRIAVPWFVLVGLVIFTTVHTQDFEDVVGDAARGRKTLPLTIGDTAARWVVILAVPFWSLFIPAYLKSSPLGGLAPVLLASIVTYRTFAKRTIHDDKLTFRFWNLWIVSIYLIPFFIEP